MALINAFLRDLWSDPWKEMTGSSRLFDQDFGYVLSPEDMVVPRYWRHPMMVPRMQRPPQASGMSEVSRVSDNCAVSNNTLAFVFLPL